MSTFADIIWARQKLGIEDAISLKTLRERYMLLVRNLHPDLNSQVDQSQDLAEITRAYQLLVTYLENALVSLADDDVRKNDPHAYHSYRFDDWLGGRKA